MAAEYGWLPSQVRREFSWHQLYDFLDARKDRMERTTAMETEQAKPASVTLSTAWVHAAQDGQIKYVRPVKVTQGNPTND